MKKIGFIGAYDKTDMLLNIAKILTVLKHNVLIIDSSINQKAKYIVPSINPTVSYITSFEDIDIAVGFKDLDEIKKYIGDTKEEPYDILLIDCDTTDRIESFRLEKADKNYFVTSFDMYSLRKGMEILDGLNNVINLTKVLYTQEALKEDNDYLDFISMGKKVMWDQQIVYFPTENGDLTVLAENQRVEKIKFKKLSILYKDSVSFMAQQILGDNTDSNVRKAIKLLERGV